MLFKNELYLLWSKPPPQITGSWMGRGRLWAPSLHHKNPLSPPPPCLEVLLWCKIYTWHNTQVLSRGLTLRTPAQTSMKTQRFHRPQQVPECPCAVYPWPSPPRSSLPVPDCDANALAQGAAAESGFLSIFVYALGLFPAFPTSFRLKKEFRKLR